MITPSFGITATERVLPKLALNFTTALLDSRVTFTRTTGVSNPATYVNSIGYITAATNNQPRFDYDPVTLACKGLLVEESKTNLILQSSAFNTTWTATNALVSTDVTTSPDGTTNADKIIPNVGATDGRVVQSITGLTSGIPYTFSVYAKANELTSLNVVHNTTGTYTNNIFNLLTGGTTPGAGSILTCTAAGNNWYRCTITATTNTTSASFQLRAVGTGNAAKGLYLWGAQFENKICASSYIPTTTTTITRNADVVNVEGTNFSNFYNTNAGTWFVRTNACNSATIFTSGNFTIIANASALKSYANTYATDQNATFFNLGPGIIQRVSYYPQQLTAAELAAITV